jgi:peptidoglycan/LPS O-acetylase OafA/YrhL
MALRMGITHAEAIRASASAPAGAGQPAAGPRFRGLDGVRALAACSILVFHVWTAGPGSYGPITLLLPILRDGVTLFFCLSGFLLYRPFAAAIICRRKSPSVRRYALRRVLRIAPAYWIVLLASTILLGDASSLRDGHGLALVGRQALLVANYDPSTIWSGLVPSWTLAIELVFYLVLPLLALASVQLARSRSSHRGTVVAACVPAAGLFAVGVVAKLAVTLLGSGKEGSFELDHTWHAVLDASFLTHADLFAYGMIVAVLHVLSADRNWVVPNWLDGLLTRVLAYLGIPAVAAGYYTLPVYLYESLVGCLGALLLLRLVLPGRTARPGLLLRTFERPTMVYLGTISYSIFLWNATVTFFLRDHGLLASTRWAPGLLLDIAIVAAVTIPLAALTYRFVELPFLQARRTRSGASEREEPARTSRGRLGRARRRLASHA